MTSPLRRRLVLALLLYGSAALAAIVVSPLVGSTRIDIGRALDRSIPFAENTDAQILFVARLPRTLAGALVGATLATAGVVFQGLLRNPLATPFTLGVSAGAALGAMLAITFGWSFAAVGMSAVTASSFAGAAAAVGVVYGLARARHRGLSTEVLLLAGVTMNAFFSALILFVQYFGDFADVRFAAAVFTNLSREHFDFHKDFEDYFGAKKILFEQIDRSRRTAVVNIDDRWGSRLAAELGGAVLTFGQGNDADVRPAPGFSLTVDGLSGTVVTPAGEIRIESPLLGLPNLYNWLAAIGAALVVGIEPAQIEAGIRQLRSVRGRFERVPAEDGDGPTVIVDYAHKPDALEKLLSAVRELAPGRRVWLLFGCGGDRDRGKRPEMGEIAGRLADQVIVTSDNPRSEDPEAIIAEIVPGLKSKPHLVFPDRRQAIEHAVAEAAADDVIVIAGKGHEVYQVIGDQVLHFDDREEAAICLKARNKKETR